MRKPTIFSYLMSLMVVIAIGSFAYVRGSHETGGQYSEWMGLLMLAVSIIILLLVTWLKVMVHARKTFIERWSKLLNRVGYISTENDRLIKKLNEIH